MSALAAFEVACWDLVGQALGGPVWKLLGGSFRTRVPAPACLYAERVDPGALQRLHRRLGSGTGRRGPDRLGGRWLLRGPRPRTGARIELVEPGWEFRGQPITDLT